MTNKLINTNAYNFLDSELKKANEVNILYNSLILNVVLFITFLLGTIIFLYYRYQNKIKHSDSYEQDKRNALLQKMINLENINKEDDMLTSLPIFTSTL
jgi:large-conductance mechanosensitive channel